MVRRLGYQLGGVLTVDGIVRRLQEFASAVGLKQALPTQILAELLDHARYFERHAASRMVDCLLKLHFAAVPILLLLLRAAEAVRGPPESADSLRDLVGDFVHLGLSKVRSQFFGLFLCSPGTA